jgi:hypothetical protein
MGTVCYTPDNYFLQSDVFMFKLGHPSMRHFATLDRVEIQEESGIITLATSEDTYTELRPRLSMRREGGYLSISVSSGPLEIALRPRYDEVSRVLETLRAVSGLQTTRQVGTGQAYIAFGIRDDGILVARPTIVADATGLMCFNLLIAADARVQLYDWLSIIPQS